MSNDIRRIPNLDERIIHRNWRVAYAESFSFISMAQPGEVVCITGPSRIGKTRLVQALASSLCGEFECDSTGLQPVVTVEAVNTGPNGSFSTKAFMQRLLEAVSHPFLSHLDGYANERAAFEKLNRTTEATLRIALERALIARQTQYLFIDESQHMRYAGVNILAPYAVMDSYKCLAQVCKLRLIIVGAYPVLEIIRNSPHLIGRKHQIHMPRYYEKQEDLQEYASIIKSYEQKLNLANSLPTLLECFDLIYHGTFGCIGLLRAWLSRAAAIAQARECGISREILRSTMLSESDRNAVASEILAGERILENNYDAGMSGFPSHEAERKTSTSKSKKGRPFQRNPVRMKAGNRTGGRND